MVWLGFGVVSQGLLRTTGARDQTSKRPLHLHRSGPVDAWMDEESGNIIHWPRAFTGTEKYPWFVDGSSRPSPFRRRREWRNTPPWAGNIGVLSVDLCGSICSGKSIRGKKKKTLYLNKTIGKPDKRHKTTTEQRKRERKVKKASSQTNTQESEI